VNISQEKRVAQKPRLRLAAGGRIELLAPGVVGWRDEIAARSFVVRHYGTLQAFALRMGLKYSAVCAAFNTNTRTSAGEVAKVRQLLGLPSAPTAASIALSSAQARRRGAA
jgi:hypothetical protein